MERDFMGLAVKKEICEEAIDAAPLRSATMQWPVSKKPQRFLSFHGSHEDKPKTGFDSLTSAGLVTITTTEIDSDRKSFSGLMQKPIIPENKGGIRYTVTTTYPTSQPKTTSLAGQHMMAPPLSPHPISAIPMLPPCTSSPVVGTTDLRNSSKISNAPAQLTIFYNGSVCVYDNVSADKAQAIMLLAGNGTSSSPAPAPAPVPVPASMSRPSILESFAVSHPQHPSPVPAQQVGWPKQGSILMSSNKFEPIKPVGSSAPGSPFTSSSTVPQFRRKSLARFLEKRKERVVNAGPYGDKESSECNSSGSCPVTAVN